VILRGALGLSGTVARRSGPRLHMLLYSDPARGQFGDWFYCIGLLNNAKAMLAHQARLKHAA